MFALSLRSRSLEGELAEITDMAQATVVVLGGTVGFQAGSGHWRKTRRRSNA